MAQQPSLSVLIPNYNHSRFLPMSLGTILAQSFRPTDFIVLDDASTDDSVKVIEDFAHRHSIIRFVRNEHNMGVEPSVNKLLEMASGDYVYIPSADDLILPEFFEKSMTLLAQYPQAGLCSTVGRLIGENGEDRGIRAIPVVSKRPRFISPEEARQTLLKYGRWIDAGTVIYRRDVLAREGGHRPELGSFADTFVHLVIALRHGACYVPEPLQCWRQMATGLASRNVADWEGLLEKGRLAGNLMRTEYRDLFPTNYVRRFERHWMYTVSVCAQHCARLEHERGFTLPLQSMPLAASRIDRLLWQGLYPLRKAYDLAWRGYAMARFGPWRWWLMGRLSILINLRKLVIAERLDM